eukprot:1149384-Pelagomonas_calceolata.AAC.3
MRPHPSVTHSTAPAFPDWHPLTPSDSNPAPTAGPLGEAVEQGWAASGGDDDPANTSTAHAQAPATMSAIMPFNDAERTSDHNTTAVRPPPPRQQAFLSEPEACPFAPGTTSSAVK